MVHLVTSNRAPGKETKNDVRTTSLQAYANCANWTIVIKKRRLVSDVELSLIFHDHSFGCRLRSLEGRKGFVNRRG